MNSFNYEMDKMFVFFQPTHMRDYLVVRWSDQVVQLSSLFLIINLNSNSSLPSKNLKTVAAYQVQFYSFSHKICVKFFVLNCFYSVLD